MIYSPWSHPRRIWLSSFRLIQSELYKKNVLALPSFKMAVNCCFCFHSLSIHDKSHGQMHLLSWVHFTMDRYTFTMDSCTFIMDGCTFIMDGCTFIMNRCTFILNRSTFIMGRCTFMMDGWNFIDYKTETAIHCHKAG